MSKHNDSVALQQLRDHVQEAIQITRGVSVEEFRENRLMQLAVVRLIEVAGEAATRVSPARRAQHPEIAWSAMIAMRNRLIHGYDSVDLDIVWRTVGEDLAPLSARLQSILESE